MNRNLVGSIYNRSSIKIAHFVLIRYTNMASVGNSCLWAVNLKKTSPLTL